MKFKWRKWNRFIHRDFGYLFFGMTIIYSLSGIAINHVNDWNPNYIVDHTEFKVETPIILNENGIKNILAEFDEAKNYRKYYTPNDNFVKVFIEDGTVTINRVTGEGVIEKTKPRYLFKPMNYLHYNPVKYWTWFSDIFAGALIIIAVSGLFILKGRTGITRRGAWLTVLGILIPVIFLLIYYY